MASTWFGLASNPTSCTCPVLPALRRPVAALIAQDPATIGRQGVDQVVAAIEGRPVQREIQTDLIAITQADMDSKSQYFYKTAC